MSARYKITLTGKQPLLLHRDNIDWQQRLLAWRTDPANKKKSVPGDDRSPGWTWIGSLYVSEGKLVVDSDNLMTMLREGGARCPQPGRAGKTYKRETQSGIVIDSLAWPLIVGGNSIPSAQFEELANEDDFGKHQAAAEKAGFTLFVKRARVGQAKHVRVRPRFDSWQLCGTLTVLDTDTITDRVISDVLTFAGAYSGLGDWRPSSPKSPGFFGTFTPTIEKL